MTPTEAVVVEGPYFEELRVGDVFAAAPGLTLTPGHAAAHQAIIGDRLRIGLDHELSRRLTGQEQPLASPALAWDVAIGQSTSVTQHVIANLFYRGLAFRRFPHLGDTLRTRTEVVALRQNTTKPGRPPTGLAALRITTVDQQDRPVLDFWRCAMLPLRDHSAQTGHTDDLALVGNDRIDVPSIIGGWHLDAIRQLYPDPSSPELVAGQVRIVTGGDVVSCAPELARLTLNIARAHHDNTASSAGRLVYGGQTIGIAFSQVVRALPDLVTVLSWDHCHHLGPVREGDTLVSSIQVEHLHPAGPASEAGRTVQLRSSVTARGTPIDPGRPVLDWRFTGLLP